MPMTAIRTRLLAPCQANSGLVAATVSAIAPFFKSSRRCITSPMNFFGVYTRYPEATTLPGHGCPLSRLHGALQGVEHPLDVETIGEIRVKREAAREAVEELRERGDEGVLVADDVTGLPEISEDRMRHVGHQH